MLDFSRTRKFADEVCGNGPFGGQGRFAVNGNTGEPRTIAIISAFRPDEGIHSAIDSARKICDGVIVVDDGSGPSYDAILDSILSKAEVIRLETNSGIAAALNAGVVAARERNADFVLTFDQDTQPNTDYADRALATYFQAQEVGVRVALVCAGLINDARVRVGYEVGRFQAAFEAPQSGFLIPMSTFDEIGLLDEDYFIDCVDTEFIFRARERGLATLISPEAQIAHTTGERMHGRWGTAPVEFSYHSPMRRYYITRNRAALFATYGLRNLKWAMRQAAVETKTAMLCIAFGPNRRKQMAAILAGLFDSTVQRRGKIRPSLDRRLKSAAS